MARFEAPLTVRSLLVFTQDIPVSAAGLDYGTSEEMPTAFDASFPARLAISAGRLAAHSVSRVPQLRRLG
jgi:hypothetical protein